MEEYTNESMIMEESGIFDDYAEETTEAQQEETAERSAEESQEQDPEQSEEKESPQTFRVKYNGEEKEITYEEAITLAQKGMNYDKVKEERDKLRDSDELKELDYWANQNNMTRSEYVKFLKDSRDRQTMTAEIQSIKEKYPEMDEAAVRELAEARAKLQSREREADEEKKAEEKKQKEIEPWTDFLKAFPQYVRREGQKNEEIPPQVFADVENGMRPIEAMLKYQNNELQRQIQERDAKIATLEKNDKNKAKALSSAAGVADAAKDPFLDGLFG